MGSDRSRERVNTLGDLLTVTDTQTIKDGVNGMGSSKIPNRVLRTLISKVSSTSLIEMMMTCGEIDERDIAQPFFRRKLVIPCASVKDVGRGDGQPESMA